jgi:translation initiation factor IF-2
MTTEIEASSLPQQQPGLKGLVVAIAGLVIVLVFGGLALLVAQMEDDQAPPKRTRAKEGKSQADLDAAEARAEAKAKAAREKADEEAAAAEEAERLRQVEESRAAGEAEAARLSAEAEAARAAEGTAA